MNLVIWILQGLLAFVFMFSGLNKAYFDERTLVKKGQTGVEGLSKGLIKFIGFSEILGSIGLILPALLGFQKMLIPISAICLGCIMIPAAVIHLRRRELKNVIINVLIFIGCGMIVYWRM